LGARNPHSATDAEGPTIAYVNERLDAQANPTIVYPDRIVTPEVGQIGLPWGLAMSGASANQRYLLAFDTRAVNNTHGNKTDREQRTGCNLNPAQQNTVPLRLRAPESWCRLRDDFQKFIASPTFINNCN
jgi:hypothetical protein